MTMWHSLYARKLIWPLRIALYSRVALERAPDVVIGGADQPYLRRWYLTPWSGWWRDQPTWWQRALKSILPNLYLHQFLRSDDDRALHDHPWFNCSLLLSGFYIEHTIAAGGINHRVERHAGDIVVRGPRAAHRVEIDEPDDCWTLFVTGPVWREWGFHCPDAGWVHWRKFTNPEDGGATIGRGCAQ